MANEDHRLNLEENSKYRVAYDLMKTVAHAEGKFPTGEEARKYYFDLYYQSIKVVYNGYDYDSVIISQKSKPSNQPMRSSTMQTW